MATKFCSGCGKALVEGARFCTGCGRVVSTAAPPDAVPEEAPLRPPLTSPPLAAPPAPAPPPPAARRPPPEPSFVLPNEPEGNWKPEPGRPAWIVPAGIGAVCLIALLAVLALVLLRGGDENEGGSELASTERETTDDAAMPDNATRSDTATETLYVLRQTNMRDRPTSQGSAILASWSRGDRVTGSWATGVDPTTRWLRVVQPDGGVGYIWEGNLDPQLIPERYPGIVTNDCQGEGCFAAGVRFIARPVRLYGDRFEWNDASHDFGFVVPEGVRAQVVEKIVLTSRPGSATLICRGVQRTWSADRSWRLAESDHGEYAPHSAPAPIETLYYLGEGYIAGRIADAGADPDRTQRISYPGDCLNVHSEPVAEDWISLRLPDGRTGWTKDFEGLICGSIYDDDPRCTGLDNR